MPPEIASPSAEQSTVFERISNEWRVSLLTLGLGTLIVVLVAAREWGEMFHQWWNIDTYSHILLVPFVIGWLIKLKLTELAKITPTPWLPGLVVTMVGLALWLAGRFTDINLIAHAGAVGALQGVVLTATGSRASLILALPICLGVFLVPFGDEIIPPLQSITAEIAIALTLASGIEASVDGIYIDTPVGLFIVAEACSGVKFLIAMVTLAVLVCFTRFESWSRRAMFMLASCIIPIIANGIRAWGTIYIAQFAGVEFAAGFDHIFYGWIFFAVVVAIIIGAAWRFFEREAEEYGWTADEVDAFPWIGQVERGVIAPVVAVAAIAAMSLLATIVAPGALG